MSYVLLIMVYAIAVALYSGMIAIWKGWYRLPRYRIVRYQEMYYLLRNRWGIWQIKSHGLRLRGWCIYRWWCHESVRFVGCWYWGHFSDVVVDMTEYQSNDRNRLFSEPAEVVYDSKREGITSSNVTTRRI